MLHHSPLPRSYYFYKPHRYTVFLVQRYTHAHTHTHTRSKFIVVHWLRAFNSWKHKDSSKIGKPLGQVVLNFQKCFRSPVLLRKERVRCKHSGHLGAVPSYVLGIANLLFPRSHTTPDVLWGCTFYLAPHRALIHVPAHENSSYRHRPCVSSNIFKGGLWVN